MIDQRSEVLATRTTQRRLLLVEDEYDTRAILTRRLDAFGWKCLAHATAESALRDRDLAQVEAVVTDVVLGGGGSMSGIELIPVLRSLGIRAPVVLVTAFADVLRVKAALNAGAAYLLEKPFSTEALRKVLNQVAGADVELMRLVNQTLRRGRLTPREEEVARAVLKGLGSSEIGARLGNSHKTIKSHLTRIYSKLGVTGRAEFLHLIFPF